MDMHADMRAQEEESIHSSTAMVPGNGRPERGLLATSSQNVNVPRADVVLAARPTHEGAALPTDYAGRGGVPPHLQSATLPKKIGSCSWLVHAGAPMEAFWCFTGPADITGYNFVATRPSPKRLLEYATRTRHHPLARAATHADGLELTGRGKELLGLGRSWATL